MVNHQNFAGSAPLTTCSRRFVMGCVGIVAGLFAFVITLAVLIGTTFNG